MKPEFGNPEHIKIVQNAARIHELVETVREKGFVGTQEILSCGECGAPIREYGKTIEDGEHKFLFCEFCESVISEKL